MKRILCALLTAAILMLSFPFVFTAEDRLGTAVNGVISVPFATQPSGAVYTDMVFCDSWFEASATEYNHALATASLYASVAGFRAGPYGEGLIRPFLARIGCAEETVLTDGFAKTDSFDDVCAFAFGLKSLADGSYLLPVIIRGGNYVMEWASNMRVYGEGYENYSYGFRKAAEYAVGHLNDYIDGITGKYGIARDDLKLWVVGYSRGAAIANNVAQIMTADGRTPAEQIFGYSFATPETVLESAKGDYRNIFAICSELDLVPRLPLVEWGFTHFGTSLYLPCESKNGSAYAGLLAGMQTEFDKFMTEIGAPEVHNNPIKNQEKAIDLIASFLTGPIPTPAEFKKEGWQDLFVDLLYHVEGDGDIGAAFIDSLIPDVRVAQALKDFFEKAPGRTNEENAAALSLVLTQISLRRSFAAAGRDRELLTMVYEMLSDLRVCLKAQRISNGQAGSTAYFYALAEAIYGIIKDGIYSPLLMQHWPEAYLAWMKSSDDPSVLFTDGHHEIVPVKKPILIGDVNGDGDVNAADVTLLNRYVLAPKKTSLVLASADIDGNGRINLADVIRLTALLAVLR